MIALLLAIAGSIQDPLAQVRADEARRVAVVARCAPAVCSVMAMDEPGGGSGVVIHPHGYVLTNFHVVGAPDKGHRPKEPKLPPLLLQAWRDEHLPLGAAHYRNRKVGLPDGELYEAIVLGIDPGSDLAVLRIVPKHDGQTFPFCRSATATGCWSARRCSRWATRSCWRPTSRRR
jgi:serine protease Do